MLAAGDRDISGAVVLLAMLQFLLFCSVFQEGFVNASLFTWVFNVPLLVPAAPILPCPSVFTLGLLLLIVSLTGSKAQRTMTMYVLLNNVHPVLRHA